MHSPVPLSGHLKDHPLAGTIHIGVGDVVHQCLLGIWRIGIRGGAGIEQNGNGLAQTGAVFGPPQCSGFFQRLACGVAGLQQNGGLLHFQTAAYNIPAALAALQANGGIGSLPILKQCECSTRFGVCGRRDDIAVFL